MDRTVVGRAAELTAVEALLDRAHNGSAALVLDGEAGIGKTTLWLAGVKRAETRGYEVLRCRPAETESALPFVSLGDLLEPVLAEVLPVLPATQRLALETALARVEPAKSFGQLAVSRAALAVVRHLASVRPVLLAIDDVQWLDPASAGICEFVARRLTALPVRLLVARRSERELPPPLELAKALEPGRLTSRRVGPLGAAELDQLLRSGLELSLPRPRLLELQRISGGNPFYALEIARSLARRGVGSGDEITVPDSLAELVRDRLAELSADARDAVLLTAAAAQPRTRLVENAAGGSDGLAEAISRGVLVLEEGRLRFSHPLLGSVTYESAAPWEQREAHLRLARFETEPERQARHLALGTEEPDETVAGELEKAAGLAAARGAPATAAFLAQHAARLTPPPADDDRRRRLSEAAEYHIASGDRPRGRSILRRIVAELPAGPERADLLWRLADAGGIDLQESIRLSEQALEEAGDEPAVCARIHTALGVFSWIVGDLARSATHSRQAAAFAELAGDDLLVAISIGELSHVEVVLGRPFRADEMERALELERRLEGFPPYLRPSFQLGVILMYTDELDTARPLLEAELARVESAGEESARIGVLVRLAELELRAGRWTEAARSARDSMTMALQAGIDQEQSVGLMIHGLVQAHIGNLDEARRAAESALAITKETGDGVVAVRSMGVLGFVELSRGDSVAALEWLSPAADRLRALGTGELSISQVVQNEIEALVALGRVEEAEETISFVEEKGRPAGRAWHEAVAQRGRALVASARGDVEAARTHLDRALLAQERLPQPFELGRTLLAQGAIERRAKNRGQAREVLTRALELFDDLGASLWAEKAAAELARIPGRTPADGALSETQRRIAELVVAGRSNKEIAASLFVSVRAVESNLTKIYAKLGIHSRTELAGRHRAPSRRP